MTAWFERVVFASRWGWLSLWMAATLLAAVGATRLHLDASFVKQVPLSHPYIHTLLKYDSQVAGPNRITVAVQRKHHARWRKQFAVSMPLTAAAGAKFGRPVLAQILLTA